MKKRLDVELVDRGLVQSRERAKVVIMEGLVYVNEQKSDKAGTPVKEDDRIEVRGETLRYVSRGGKKLGKGKCRSFRSCWRAAPVWTSAPPPAALPIVCCKTVRSRCMRWTSAMDSWRGRCAPTSVWST